MVKELCCLIAVLALSACSTVDRITYYSPMASSEKVSGPVAPSQGFMNFDAEPDRYDSQGISITIANDTHPYLFGPWFVTVIPVFPISWLVDAFIDDSLKVHVFAAKDNYERLNDIENYRIIVNADTHAAKEIRPSKLESSGSKHVWLTFPVAAGDFDSFVFMLNSDDVDFKSIKVNFKYTSRWRWKQYVVNG